MQINAKNFIPQLTLLIISVIIVVFREVSFFTNPRFWAEEGVIFFEFARSHLWHETLIQPHLGYYSLLTNFASLLSAKLTPLEHAPLATTVLAFLVQITPLLIIIYGKSKFWESLLKKTIAISIIIFTPISSELWLNTINSQFYLSLTTVLILCENTQINSFRKYIYRFLIILASLSGVISCFLAPLYCFRAFYNKNRETVLQAALISICAIIQMLIVVQTSSFDVDMAILEKSGLSFPDRSVCFDPPTLGSILFMKNILLPILGIPFAEMAARYLHASRQSGGINFIIIGYSCLALTLLFLSVLTIKLGKGLKLIFPAGYLLLVLPSTLFALVGNIGELINPWASQRYYLIPNILIVMSIFLSINFTPLSSNISRIINFGLATILAISLINGISTYRSSLTDGFAVFNPTWPSWKQEVLKWEKDHALPIKIWPQPGWHITINE